MKVWVQAWTAKVPNGIEIDLDELKKIQGFENIDPMIPVLVNLKDEYKFVNTHLSDAPKMSLQQIEELNEVLEPWKD